jgi:hypothetical protein
MIDSSRRTVLASGDAAAGGKRCVERMPTLLPFGEGRAKGEAIDMSTRSIRRGSGHGTSERWFG